MIYLRACHFNNGRRNHNTVNPRYNGLIGGGVSLSAMSAITKLKGIHGSAQEDYIKGVYNVLF